MMGLRAKDSAIRTTFMELLDKQVPKPLLQRLEYLFTCQNWEPMGSYFWIKQVLSSVLFIICTAVGHITTCL